MTTPLTRIPQNAGVPGSIRMLVRWLNVAAPCTFWFWPFPPVQDLLAHAALLEATTRGTDSLWTYGPWYGHSAMFHAAGGLVARQAGGLLAARLMGRGHRA